MLPFRRKAHNSGLWEKKKSKTQKKQIIPGTIIFNVRENLIYISTRGTQNSDSSKRQARTSASCPFPGTMTTETTVSKGQEFFSPGQTEGDTGGTLIGSAAVSLLLLTQPRWTMCAIRTRNFYSQLIATLVGYERKWHEKNRERCRQNSFPV